MPAQIPKSWFPGFATRPGSPGLPSVHDVPSRRTWASGETVWFSLCGLPVTPAPALSPPYWQSTLAAHHAMVNKNASVRGGGNTAWSNVELDLVRAPGVLSQIVRLHSPGHTRGHYGGIFRCQSCFEVGLCFRRNQLLFHPDRASLSRQYRGHSQRSQRCECGWGTGCDEESGDRSIG